jgi:hypothetical protein
LGAAMRIWVAIIVMVVISGGLWAGRAQNTGAQFSITINTPQAKLKAGSEVRISVVVTNLTDQYITFGHAKGGAGEFDFDIDMRNSAGLVPDESEYYRAVLSKQDPNRPTTMVVLPNYLLHGIEPRGTLTEPIELDKLYDLSKPDKYTIQVERIDDATKAIVKSNKITVTLTP